MQDKMPGVEYRRLPVCCQCGWVPKHILGVGLSSTHDLVVEWHCPRCRKNVCAVKPLSVCWRECFTDAADLPIAEVEMDTPGDRKFLHSVGIKYSEE
jgi:hypothetical protein